MDGHRLLVTIHDAEGDRFPVEVSVLRDGVATAPTRGSFGCGEIPELPPIAVDSNAAGEIALAKAGLALFDLLAGAGLGQSWTADGPAPLLLDIRPPELSILPWELLRDPNTRRPFSSRDTPAARGRLPFPLRPPAAGVPIRLLVIVGKPDDDEVLCQEDEIEAIHEGLHNAPCCWHVEVIRGPSRETLYQEYTSLAPDVLHMIGHGTHRWGGPAMEMLPPDEAPWALSAEYLVGTLPAERLPRLVVLNACRTAEEPNAAARLARGLTDALLDNGVAAVVAMQGDVASAPAATFTKALYRSLAAQQPLDVAVADARASVANADGSQPRDWALPVLELRADPAAVLRQSRQRDPVAVIRQHNGFDAVPHLVDRAPQRRRLHQRVGSTACTAKENGTEPDGLLFVTGDEGVGKTILMRSCVVSQAVAGTAVVYHSLEQRGAVSAQDFVLGVIDAVRRWLGQWATQLCADTDVALRGVFGLPVPGAAPAAPAWPGGGSGTSVDDAYTMVRDLLVTLGRTQPVVLVLDHLGWINERDALVRGLLAPASRDELRGVQIIVVEGSEALTGIAGRRSEIPIVPDRQIQLTAFDRAEIVTLTREFLARCRPDDVDPKKWAALRTLAIDWAQTEMADTAYEVLEPREIPLKIQGSMLKLRLMYDLRAT